MHQLIQIAYSPWSERARWALDHHGVTYRKVHYLPGLDEPALRWRLRRLGGKVTLPVLFPDDGPPVTDSLDIARWADARGTGPTLFPAGDEAAIADWHALSEAMLAAGRVLTTRRTAENDDALREALPPSLRRLGPIGLAVARFSCWNLLRKYDPATTSEEACLATLDAGLARLRAAVEGRSTLRDGFGFADVTMVTALMFVAPPEGYGGLGPASRVMWTQAALAERYADVIAWRDALWAGRPVRSKAA